MTNPPYYGPPQPSPWPTPAPKPSRMPMILAFVGIFIAIALGVVALFRPAAQAAAPAPEAPKYSEQQVAEAKKAVCEAHDAAFAALKGAGSMKSDDPNVQLTIAVNIRLSIEISSLHLTKTLSQNPATTPDLADDVRELTAAYDGLVLAQLANASDSELDPLNSKLDAADKKVVQACR